MKITSNKLKPNLKKLTDLDEDPDEWAGSQRSFFSKGTPPLSKMLDKILEEKGEFLCSQPFIHMNIPTYGYANICCCTSMSVKKHISEIGFNGIWNEPEFFNLRKEMVSGHKDRKRTLKTCSRCIQNEYYGFTSIRESYNKDLYKDPDAVEEWNRLIKHVKEKPDEKYPIPKIIHTTSLKVWGNFCNLQCIMCSPEDSSGVGKEQMELGEITKEGIKYTTEARTGRKVLWEPPLITVDDSFIDEFQYWDVIKKTKRLKLIGGETLLIKQNVQLIEKCVKMGWAKDKKLFIFTNNFGHPNMEYIRDLLSNFESVMYKCSLEFWGQKNNYIRFPSKWEEVYKNIKLMNELPNLQIGLTCTLNPLSIGYVNEIVEGQKEMNNEKPFFQNVVRPQWFTLQSLPDDIRDFYLDRLYNTGYAIIEKCEKAIHSLEKREFIFSRYEEMIKRIIARDKFRNDNILKYLPEWKPHFQHDPYYND
tara:strand:- start:163 stop:1587 length:1425 start_codon:yes stop_codon:yes gene_type:complete